MLSAVISVRVEIEALLTAILCVFAVWRGGGPEKAIAATFAGMWLIDLGMHAVAQGLSAAAMVPKGHLLIDLFASAAFVGISLIANRVYPLWIAGIQLISTIAHLVRALNPSISQSALAILMIAPSYFEILVFTIGTWCHLRRVQQAGLPRSWDIS